MVFRQSLLAAPAIMLMLLIVPAGSDPVRPQVRQIPLSAIFSTSGQGGLEVAHSGTRDGKPVFEFGAALQNILDSSRFNGASNAFLVDAPTINEAMSATTRVFSGRAADVPATLNMPNAPRGNHWLVVYLGVAGSGPVRWIVDSVAVEGGIVRFDYHKSPIGASTKDMHQYYYWVPLGKLDDGVYKLELYDTSLKDITLSRRVEIKSPDAPKRTRK